MAKILFLQTMGFHLLALEGLEFFFIIMTIFVTICMVSNTVLNILCLAIIKIYFNFYAIFAI